MKTCIVIASHIYYDNQLDYLKICLSSLVRQTIKSDIYVSISFANKDYYEQFIIKIKDQFKDVVFYILFLQKSQMEHIYNLLQYIKEYDLVMFCDDDDTYNENRVEYMINNYKLLYSKFGKDLGGLTENQYEPTTYTEFWSYAIRPELLINFFKYFENDMDLLKHKFADMYFRSYLRFNKKKVIGILVMSLYNHDKNNPNSICSRKKDTDDIIRDDLILSTICGRYSKFNYILEYYKLCFADVYRIVPEYDRIERIANEIFQS